jgi:hypothetical protein
MGLGLASPHTQPNKCTQTQSKGTKHKLPSNRHDPQLVDYNKTSLPLKHCINFLFAEISYVAWMQRILHGDSSWLWFQKDEFLAY